MTDSLSGIVSILSNSGLRVVDQIKANLAATSTNATGKTQQSLEYTVTTKGSVITLTVLGRPYFMTVETGRKATPDKKPPRAMVEAIKEWMTVRGITGSPYGLAMGIMKHGTKLHQKGGRTDIVTNVIGDSFVERVAEDIMDNVANTLLENMVGILNNGKRVA